MSIVDRLFPRTGQDEGQATAAPPAVPSGAPAPSTVYPVAPPAPSAGEWQPAPYGSPGAVVPETPAPQGQDPAAPSPTGSAIPAPATTPATLPAPAPPASPPPSTRPTPTRQDIESRRQELSRRLAELQWDLGGLAYEMAIRDHFRLDVLARRAAELQEVDAELAEVERQLRLEDAGASGECPSCGALHSRGAVFCWACGHQLLPTQAAGQPPRDGDG